jgi:ABC-type Zn uptake system ZnuABC Zn-binding protein ZnuA
MPRMLLTAVLLACAMLAAPACDKRPAAPPADPGALNLMATILPMQNLTLAIAAGVPGVHVRQLVPIAAGCPHDYQLEPGDLKALENAKALIAVGAGYEPFLDKLADNYRGRLTIVRLDKNVERIAGDREPHPFVSPKQAAAMALTLAEALAQLDPPHAARYLENGIAAATKLQAIQDEFAKAVQALPNKRVAMATTTFAYLVRDAGLETGPALTNDEHHGLSAGEVAAIMARLKAQKPAAILADLQVDPRTPRMFAEEIGVPVATVEVGMSGPTGPQAFVDDLTLMTRTVANALAKGNAP